MKVLVTGAAGFLGNVLCRLLVQQGYVVTAFDLFATTADSLKGLSIHKIDGNILDKKTLSHACANQEVIFHLASKISILQDKSLHAINVEGTHNVAEAALAANVKRFIHVSSIHAYHRFPWCQSIDENRKLALTGNEFDYDKTKALAELACLKVFAKGLNGIIINPTCFIGPFDFAPSQMGISINQFFTKKIIPLIQGGFNFVDVRDVAQTLINSIEKGNPGERYIVGGEWMSINSLIKHIVEIRKKTAIRINIPYIFLFLQAYAFAFYGSLFKKNIPFSNQSLGHLKHHRFIDDRKARKTLDHHPRSLTNTLEDIFSWLRKDEQRCY